MYHSSVGWNCVTKTYSLKSHLYPSSSSAVFRTFSCDSFDTGASYLRADYSIDCASSSHRFCMMTYASLVSAVDSGRLTLNLQVSR